MAETKSDTAAAEAGWQAWATRTTAILAVLAALSSGRWGASNLQAILEQGKVNDTWAYYQAKSVKEHSAEQIRDLAAALASGPPAERAAALSQLQRQLDADARREDLEKQQREADARRFELRRDQLVERGFWYELSFACLQLGVILCTIASGAKRPAAWYAGVAFGALGLLLLINGMYTLHHAPRTWYQGASDEMGYHAAPASAPTTAEH
jgi:hypothetical protein